MMGQLDMAAKEAMFTKERMTGEAGAKSQKLTHLAAEKARLLGEVGRLTGERETLLRNRENYDSEEFALRNEISSREEAASRLKAHCDELTVELSHMSQMDHEANTALSAKRRIDAVRTSNLRALASSAKSTVERNFHQRYDVPVMPRHNMNDSDFDRATHELGSGIMHAT